MPNVALFIKSRAKPGKRNAVKALWETHLKPRAAANPAQVAYYFCFDNDDPDVFCLFEVYDDPAVLAANATSDFFAAYMAEVGPLLAGPPEVTTATPVWTKG